MNDGAADNKKRRSLLPGVKTLTAAFAALFLIFFLSGTPAQTLAAMIMRQQPGLQLQDVNGSAWNGSAGGAAVRIGKHWLFLGAGQWRFNPLSLLSGRAAMHWRSDRPGLEMEGRISATPTGSLRVRELRLFTQAVLASPWLPQNLAPMGALVLRLNELNWKDGVRTLDARAAWQQARIFYNNREWELGDLEIIARNAENGALTAEIRDLEQGPLRVELLAQYNRDMVTLRGEVAARENAGRQWRQFLRDLFGKAREDGVFELNIEHKLSGAAAKAVAAKIVPAKTAPSEVSPAETVPAENAPAENAPAENAPAENAPTEVSPAENAPTENAPTENAPAENAPTENAPAEAVPGN